MLKPQERVKILKQLVKEGRVKILYLDCETSPMLVWTHYIGNKVAIYHEQIEKETRIITIQWMYEGDKEAKYVEWEYTSSGPDDKSMLEDFISNVYNYEEDDVLYIVVGQNHKDFDLRVLSWRANVLEVTPMFQNLMKLDTLKQAQSSFRAPSYKLDYRSKTYGLGGKHKMEFQDWIDISKGSADKLNKMINYGLKDIYDLQDIFWRELPYYTALPAPLEKLLENQSVCCSLCAEKKKGKYNVEPKRFNNKKGWICLNCNHRWN